MKVETKPGALVYDATAGNRTMWVTKDHPYVLFGDIEEDLTIKPDDYIDSRDTGLPDESKYLVIFDPPHEVNHQKNKGYMTTPNYDLAVKKWGRKTIGDAPPSYYGADKYKSKKELLEYIYKSQKEFQRILLPGGIVFLKWAERCITLKRVLKLFRGWNLMLKIPCHKQGPEKTPTYWVMLMKSPEGDPQAELTAFSKSRRTGEYT